MALLRSGRPVRAAVTATAKVPSPFLGSTVAQRLNALSPAKAQAFRRYVAGATAAPAAAPAAAGPDRFVLPGSAEAEFGAQRSAVNEDYIQGLAENNFARDQVGIGYGDQFRDAATNYQRIRATFNDQYVNRGISGSGIANAGLQELTSDRLRQIGDLRKARATEYGTLDLRRSQLERQRALAIANLRMKHQATLSDAAGRSIV